MTKLTITTNYPIEQLTGEWIKKGEVDWNTNCVETPIPEVFVDSMLLVKWCSRDGSNYHGYTYNMVGDLYEVFGNCNENTTCRGYVNKKDIIMWLMIPKAKNE